MKIELTRSDEGNGELWVRVLSSDPLGPQAWEQIKRSIEPAHLDGYGNPIRFYPLDEPDDDEPDYGFEQWYILPKMAVYK